MPQTVPPAVQFRTSSYSSGGGECVEVSTGPSGPVLVRDSKNREGGHLTVGRANWAAVTQAVQAGQFD